VLFVKPRFEWKASREKNPKIKAVFEKQAASYRKLAADHAKRLGLNLSQISN
jgi:hypothetical protein